MAIGMKSGKGRPELVSNEIRRRLQEEGKSGKPLLVEMVDTLLRTYFHAKTHPALRLQIFKEMVDRVQGRPAQQHVITGPGGGPLQISHDLTPAQIDEAEREALHELEAFGIRLLKEKAIDTEILEAEAVTPASPQGAGTPTPEDGAASHAEDAPANPGDESL